MNYFLIKCRRFYAPQLCKFEFVVGGEYEYASDGLIILQALQHGLCILESNESQRPEYKLVNYSDRCKFKEAFNGCGGSYEWDWSTCIDPSDPTEDEIARIYNALQCDVFSNLQCVSEYGLRE